MRQGWWTEFIATQTDADIAQILPKWAIVSQITQNYYPFLGRNKAGNLYNKA